MQLKAEPETMPDSPARVVSVQESLVSIEAGWKDGRRMSLTKNEVVYIEPSRNAGGGFQERLKSEVLRVRGVRADIQVFEDTRGGHWRPGHAVR
jgi:V/A-type H+-transporting ATPase subunit A